MWLCKCTCGKEAKIVGQQLVSGDTKSCGCYQIDKQRKKPFEWLYTHLLWSAKNSKRICKLTYEEFVEFTKIENCHYCGTPIEWRKHQVNDSVGRYNIDRKNNDLGYTKENCVVCCPLCNSVKGKILSHDEMMLLGPGILEIYKMRSIMSSYEI